MHPLSGNLRRPAPHPPGRRLSGNSEQTEPPPAAGNPFSGLFAMARHLSTPAPQHLGVGVLRCCRAGGGGGEGWACIGNRMRVQDTPIRCAGVPALHPVSGQKCGTYNRAPSELGQRHV